MHAGMFEVGKLPVDVLQGLLERYGGRDRRLVLGPRIGEDAAVLRMGEQYLVVKSDPITFAADNIGWYLVHVNANDIATMGAKPRWLLLTLLLPEAKTDRALVERIFAQVNEACQALGIVLCGGHTEITHGLDRPIAVGHMLGEVEQGDLVCTAGAQVGDQVILTKGIAIEGTAVLAREMGERLAVELGHDLVARAARFLTDPGISVVHDAEVVCKAGRPHAMHDPTEGGLATGLWELAWASGKGIVVDPHRIRLFPETAALCRFLRLDPLGVLASGALLVTAGPEEAERMTDALAGAGIGARIIGRVVDGPPAVQTLLDEEPVPLPTFVRDEVARLLEQST
jgi:hydrogenase expression/formation protein HypE